MKNKVGFLFVIPIVLMMSGCVGEEPNDVGYITAMGIDNAGDGAYKYTIQFANPTKISGGAAEEGGTGGNIVENIVVEAPTIYAAINNGNEIVSKDLSLAHAKVIAVSEEVAREGLLPITDVIARNNDIRPDVYIAIAEDAQKYLEGVKPVIELNPVKYYQLIYENKGGGSVPQNKAADFYMACVSGDMDCVLPLAGVVGGNDDDEDDTDAGSGGDSEKQDEPTKNTKNQDAKLNEKGFQNNTKNYFAGEAGILIKNESETLGLAIFRGDKYVGKMGSIEAQLYNILANMTKRTRISFFTEQEKLRPITMMILPKRKTRYKINSDEKTVEVDIKLDGEILSAPDGEITDGKKAGEMVDEAAEELLGRAYGEWGVDIMGIKGMLKKNTLTQREYDEKIKNFNPTEWRFKVNTKLSIRDTGMMQY